MAPIDCWQETPKFFQLHNSNVCGFLTKFTGFIQMFFRDFSSKSAVHSSSCVSSLCCDFSAKEGIFSPQTGPERDLRRCVVQFLHFEKRYRNTQLVCNVWNNCCSVVSLQLHYCPRLFLRRLGDLFIFVCTSTPVAQIVVVIQKLNNIQKLESFFATFQ